MSAAQSNNVPQLPDLAQAEAFIEQEVYAPLVFAKLAEYEEGLEPQTPEEAASLLKLAKMLNAVDNSPAMQKKAGIVDRFANPVAALERLIGQPPATPEFRKTATTVASHPYAYAAMLSKKCAEAQSASAA